MSSSRSWFVIFSVPGMPTTLPAFFLCACTAAGSSPFELWIPPRESLTATTFAPRAWSRSCAIEPAFPYPWIATVRPASLRPRCLHASSIVTVQPLAVASRRPSDPPREIGFPVTTPGDAKPWRMVNVSMIHAIT